MTLFCWRARRRIADSIGERSGLAAAPGRLALERHLGSCAACRAELIRQERMVEMLREAARLSDLPPAPGHSPSEFVDGVLREARARRARAARSNALPGPAVPFPPRAVPLAGALSLLLAAAALAYFLGGSSVGDGRRPPAGATIASGAGLGEGASPEGRADLDDAVAAPREVPFVIQQDLVGARRGRIPLTTYVLEPPPDEKPVLRTSL